MLVWDEQGLLGRCNQKPERAKRLIAMFLEDMPTSLKQLQKSIADNDAEAINRQAHTLKGIAANLGALKLQEVALNIEQNANQTSRICGKELSQALSDEIEALTEELQDYLNE